jgi:hypothetical protein
MDHSDETKDTTRTHTWVAVTLAVAAGLLRLFPHAWNFTPMSAIGIFAGARLRGWRAFAVPLGVRIATDLILWQWKYPDTFPFFPFEYLSYVACVMLGWILIRTSSPARIMGMGLIASVVFFLLSNFGAWLQLTDLYPRTYGGLLLSYEKGLPFYRGTLLGDLIYTPVLFGTFYLVTRWLDQKATVPKPVAVEADQEAP